MLLPEQALHEALMRQEELLAYIDRQEEAKLRVSFKILFLSTLEIFLHTSCSLVLTDDCVRVCRAEKEISLLVNKRFMQCGGMLALLDLYACIFTQ